MELPIIPGSLVSSPNRPLNQLVRSDITRYESFTDGGNATGPWRNVANPGIRETLSVFMPFYLPYGSEGYYRGIALPIVKLATWNATPYALGSDNSITASGASTAKIKLGLHSNDSSREESSTLLGLPNKFISGMQTAMLPSDMRTLIQGNGTPAANASQHIAGEFPTPVYLTSDRDYYVQMLINVSYLVAEKTPIFRAYTSYSLQTNKISTAASTSSTSTTGFYNRTLYSTDIDSLSFEDTATTQPTIVTHSPFIVDVPGSVLIRTDGNPGATSELHRVKPLLWRAGSNVY